MCEWNYKREKLESQMKKFKRHIKPQAYSYSNESLGNTQRASTTCTILMCCTHQSQTMVLSKMAGYHSDRELVVVEEEVVGGT